MGKLFFYSDQTIESPGNQRLDHILLKDMDLKNTRIGYIPSTEDRDKTYFNLKAQYYRHYGIQEVLFFDLWNEFDPSKIDELLKCDIIHLSAGNPIELRNAIKHRKLENVLFDYFNQGGILVGVSAGAVQFGKSTKLFQLHIGDSNDELAALKFVNFNFLPHYNRWNENFKRAIQNYAETTGTIVYAGNDGDGIIVEDGKIQLIGDIVEINGQK